MLSPSVTEGLTTSEERISLQCGIWAGATGARSTEGSEKDKARTPEAACGHAEATGRGALNVALRRPASEREAVCTPACLSRAARASQTSGCRLGPAPQVLLRGAPQVLGSVLRATP